MSIILEPRYAYAYCGRRRFYNEQGHPDLARADFEKVVELDSIPQPGVSCAHFAYYFLGQKEKADDYMNKLIETSENRAGTYYDAACLYSIMNEPEKVIDYLTKAFELGYCRIAHTYADHDLDNIREWQWEFFAFSPFALVKGVRGISSTVLKKICSIEPHTFSN